MSRRNQIADADLDVTTQRTVAFDGFRPLARHMVRLHRLDGSAVEQERYLFEIGHVVAIIPTIRCVTSWYCCASSGLARI